MNIRSLVILILCAIVTLQQEAYSCDDPAAKEVIMPGFNDNKLGCMSIFGCTWDIVDRVYVDDWGEPTVYVRSGCFCCIYDALSANPVNVRGLPWSRCLELPAGSSSETSI